MIAALALAALSALPVAPVVPAQAPSAERGVIAFVPDAWAVEGAAYGALATGTACPAEIALTLSAGRRTVLRDGCATPVVEDGAVLGWHAIVEANAARRSGARPGTFASYVAASDGCVSASGPLAALVATDLDGRVAGHRPGDCGVHVMEGLPAAEPGTRVLLVSMPRQGHLARVALLGGNGVLRGTTKRDGLVTAADVTSYATGARTITQVPGDVGDVRELDTRAHLHKRYFGVWATALITLPMLLYIWLLFGRRRAGRTERRIALVLATYPAAGFLASLMPWWRFSPAGAVAVGAVVAAMAALLAGGTAVARAVRAPVEVGVAGASALVFAADLLTGGYLQETGIASYSVLAGGRFHGLGNVGFAILTTAAVITAGAAATRYGPRAWLALLPLIPLVALPGADFGGAVTLTAVVAVALATRARRTAVIAGILGGLAVALAFAVLDYQRADPTHLGRFVGEIVNGGWTDTVVRKALAAAETVATFYPLLVVGSVAMAVALLRTYRDRTIVRPLAALLVVGSLVNDSGLMVAAAGLAVAVPLLLSYATREARP